MQPYFFNIYLIWLLYLRIFLHAHGTFQTSNDKWEHSFAKFFYIHLEWFSKKYLAQNHLPYDANFHKDIEKPHQKEDVQVKWLWQCHTSILWQRKKQSMNVWDLFGLWNFLWMLFSYCGRRVFINYYLKG